MSTEKVEQRRRKIDPRIRAFIETRVALDPKHWSSHENLWGHFIRVCGYEAEQMNKKAFVAALRTVPGYRAARSAACSFGCFGLRYEEDGIPRHIPRECLDRAFQLLGATFVGRVFEATDVTRLAQLNPAVADTLAAAGAARPKINMRHWLDGVRDWRHGGYVLRRVIRDKDYWRYWLFEPIGE
jgi:hypothetical protein